MTNTTLSPEEQESYRRLLRPYFDPIRIEGNTIVEGIITSLPYMSGMFLDLGCGAKPYAHMVNNRIERYVGVDLRPNAESPPTLCCDSLHLPFKDESFDSILCTQVLEHVRNPFRVMAEMSRVLRVGGHAAVTVPASWPLHEEPYDYFRYTKFGLGELARINNLEPVLLKERAGAIAAIAQLVGAMLYDIFGSRSISRIPMKIFFAPILWLCQVLDRIFYSPKFTLGYTMVVRKSGGTTAPTDGA